MTWGRGGGSPASLPLRAKRLEVGEEASGSGEGRGGSGPTPPPSAPGRGASGGAGAVETFVNLFICLGECLGSAIERFAQCYWPCRCVLR